MEILRACRGTPGSSLQPLHPQHRPDWSGAWRQHGRFPGNMCASPSAGYREVTDQTPSTNPGGMFHCCYDPRLQHLQSTHLGNVTLGKKTRYQKSQMHTEENVKGKLIYLWCITTQASTYNTSHTASPQNKVGALVLSEVTFCSGTTETADLTHCYCKFW